MGKHAICGWCWKEVSPRPWEAKSSIHPNLDASLGYCCRCGLPGMVVSLQHCAGKPTPVATTCAPGWHRVCLAKGEILSEPK